MRMDEYLRVKYVRREPNKGSQAAAACIQNRAKAVRHRQLCCSTREGKQCRLAGLSFKSLNLDVRRERGRAAP